MALTLARSLLQEGRFDPGAQFEACVRRHRSCPFDEGSTTAGALAGGGKSASAGSQANGSLMRISPLAIFSFARPDEAVEWARADSALTHPNKVGIDVAVEALRDFSRRHRGGVNDLARFARICRVARVIQPYLDSIA